MNLSDARRRALILMREWTNDGSVIPETDNADYLKSCDDLANMAQNEIARRCKIPASVVLSDATKLPDLFGDMIQHQMPSDFWKAKGVTYIEGADIYDDPYHCYRWVSRNVMAVSPSASGTFRIDYYKWPTQIVTDENDLHANDSHEFEIDPETLDLIPIYIAAQLLMDEDRGRATIELNKYYGRLSELTTNDKALPKRVRDVW